MILVIDGHAYRYEIESLCNVFFPYEKITITDIPVSSDERLVYTGYTQEQDVAKLSVFVQLDGKTAQKQLEFSLATPDFERQCGIALSRLLYDLLTELTAYHPQWGMLIGVRPIKLLRRLTEQMGAERAVEYLQNTLGVTPQKTAISLRTMAHEQPILAVSRPESFSLYISIPFCPTRCAYCSFIAQSTEKTAKLIPLYTDLLCKELIHTAAVAKACNLRLETIYMGGGTPTTLSAEQLVQVIDTVYQHFDLSNCREFTIEAGRPDTITSEKLAAMRTRDITRISINPQTLEPNVLDSLGRGHTVEQVFDSFALARAHGFTNINMDLIAGLAGDTPEGFARTLTGVLDLSPESITVHTLALKRASSINQSGKTLFVNDGTAASEILAYADAQLTNGGYIPYYLYRQSRMVGNLENTGWAKPSYENFYNVYIMDETHTILACGAGAVSKLKHPYQEDLTRIFNFKFPNEYISRFSEMLARTEQVKAFYGQTLG